MSLKNKFAKIIGTGSALPKQILTNVELEKMLDTTDAWIVERTGIKQRHISSAGETAADLAVLAAKRALEEANCSPQDIDFIVVATTTGKYIFPSVACIVQDKLKIPVGAAFDISAACSGFIYALSMANNAIKLAQATRALVIGTDTLTKVVNWEDRSTSVLFGDGAGAVVLEGANDYGIIDIKLKANGKYKDLLVLNNANISPQEPYIYMDGSKVFKLAVSWLSDIIVELLSNNNLIINQIDWIISHQANIRILQATAKKLNITMEKMIITIEQHANTSAASVPLALDHAIKAGKIKSGQKILLEAFGGGLTWGAALLEY